MRWDEARQVTAPLQDPWFRTSSEHSLRGYHTTFSSTCRAHQGRVGSQRQRSSWSRRQLRRWPGSADRMASLCIGSRARCSMLQLQNITHYLIIPQQTKNYSGQSGQQSSQANSLGSIRRHWRSWTWRRSGRGRGQTWRGLIWSILCSFFASS